MTGERSLQSLDRQIGMATENFWKLLNVVLDDREFAITCERVVLTGSHLAERMCMTRAARDELSIAGQAQVAGQSYDASARISVKNRELNTKIVAAVNTNPQLHAAVLELARLKTEYKTAAAQQPNERAEPSRRPHHARPSDNGGR